MSEFGINSLQPGQSNLKINAGPEFEAKSKMQPLNEKKNDYEPPSQKPESNLGSIVKNFIMGFLEGGVKGGVLKVISGNIPAPTPKPKQKKDNTTSEVA